MKPIHENATGLLTLVLRLVVAGVFVTAAIEKILDPVAFEGAILSYRVAGAALAGWTALLLPWLELVTGFGLLLRPIRRTSGCILGLLLLGFIGLHISAWTRGLDIDCGCFGAPEETVGYHWLILRNSALLAATLWSTYESFRNSDARLPSNRE
ncbi:MAG: MauE/DoxX family redox-associated membrane protein [Opitutales bacterium]